MTDKKNIFVINGSASENSSNQKLINNFADLTKDSFNLTIFNDLKTLLHFDPELSLDNTPKIILDFRDNIRNADGITMNICNYSQLLFRQMSFNLAFRCYFQH